MIDIIPTNGPPEQRRPAASILIIKKMSATNIHFATKIRALTRAGDAFK